MSTKPKIDAAARQMGERLSQLMKAKGLSPKGAAAKLDYTESGIGAILSGRNAGFFLKVLDWCELLDMTPNELLGVDTEALPPANASLDEELAQMAFQAMLMDLGLPKDEARLAARGAIEAAREEAIEGIDRGVAARAAAVARLRDAKSRK